MKRKLQFCLAVILGLTASVGWFHAQEDTPKVKITTDLIGTQVNKEITYGVSTFPDATLGSPNVIVEMALEGTNKPDLKDWNVQYYEVKTSKWMPASAYIKDGVYTFGPPTGFPLQTATSYFRMTPKAEGTYQYKLTIKKADTKETVATKDFGLTVAAGYPVLVNEARYGAVAISNDMYASLGTAVNFAKEGDKLSLSPGIFVLSPGTKEVQGQSGWYLPIDKQGLTIEGQEGTSLVPDEAIVPNTNLPSQNFITVLSNDVKIENMTIVTKLEANKAVEVLGKNITLKNLEFTRLGSADNATYAGSVYFNPSDKNIGTVTLSDLRLYNGRFSFTGATKGEVTMNNIWIEYKDLKIAERVLGNNSIQDYPPFGAINNKPELKINGHESVKVTFYKSDAECYQLDAATVANMPAEAILALTPGIFELSSQLVINKPLVLSGAAADDGKPQTILKAKADANWPASNDKKNLISIEGNGTGTVKLLRLYVSESKASGINAQSAMTTEISNVALEKSTNAGMLVHSKVIATGLLTINNGWGGVNIDKGTPAYTPFFEFDATSTFAEPSKIWAEKTDGDPKDLVKVPDADAWYSYEGKGGEDNKVDMYYWTNSKNLEVSTASELKNAISRVTEGGTIILKRGATFGTTDAIQSFGAVKAKNVTIKATEGEGVKPKVYGTIQLMEDSCTVEGLEFHTKGGSHPLKNAIDVVAMSVTIRNNDFIMTAPTTGSVGNGITIWPCGTAQTASFVVSGNTFTNFTGTAGIWNSTAFQIADACSLNEHFGQPYTTEKSKTVVIANEKNYWTDNTFNNCDADYVHATWPENTAVYSFVGLSQSLNNVSVLKEAIANAAENAQIFVKGTYEFGAKLVINKPIILTGVTTATDTTTFKANSNFSGDNLISVEGIEKTVAISNLIIKESPKYGLHTFNSKDVKLTSLVLKENKAGGLLVNGSTVTADKLTTSGNAWGGIEVGKGVGVTTDPKLTISNSVINEVSQIWADTDPSKEGNEKIAEWVAGTGWNMFVEQPNNKNKQTFWSQKKKITINVTKSNFFYDDKNSSKKQTVTYTVTPTDVKSVTVKYYDIKDGKPSSESGSETTDGKSAVGSYFVIFSRAGDDNYLALSDTVTMSINKKGVPEASAKPTASTVEAGQPLSMSFLSGGKAVVAEKDIPGTFTWVDANMTVQEGKKNYAIIFTPANQGEFETSVDSIEIDAKRYFTVTTGVSTNGKATFSNKSTSDRYARNTVLNFVLTPETGYEFTGWNGTGKKENSYTVGQDTSFVASFAKKKFKVTTVVPENVTLTVKAGDSEITSGNMYDNGTVLVVTASTSGENKMIKTIKTTRGSAINKGQIILDAETEITVEVADKPQQPQQVAVTAAVGGVVRLTADGKEVVPGSFLAQGTKVVIERTPNKGYKLSDIANAREEKTVGSSTLTITSTFVKEVYSIIKTTGAGYTLSVDKTTGNYGDQVTVDYTVNPGYKVIALMVNAKEVPNGSTFTLTENTTVQAIVKEKAVMTVVTDKQSYVYNGFNQAFVVKATPAGLDSLSVSYVQNGATVNPINAGLYTVQINRKEDDNFKAYNGTATLEITKAPIVITARPSVAEGTGGAASVGGAWSSGSSKPDNAVTPMTKSLRSTTTYTIYTPSSNNYSVGYCVPASSLDMTVTTAQEGEGTVTVWDGNLQITGEGKNAVKSVELRVVATPAEGYKFDSWTSGVESDENKASVTVTPSADAIAFKAKFVAKTNLTPAISEGASAVYDGTAKGTSLKIKSGSVENGWSYTFQQGGITVVPVNAGKYDVLVTRAADTDNNACRTLISNAFDITKATPTVTKAPTATVVKGAMLYSAEVTSGAATTDGQFVWKEADKAVTDAMTTATMTFVPSSENYATVETNATLTKTDLQVVSFVQPENGTITVKRGETVLASGDAIAKDDKLTITAAPANGYELNGAIIVTGVTLADGVYTVSGSATVTVVASFKKTQSGGGTPDPDPVPVTGISLDKTELTLTRLSTYTLIATVAPDNADNKSVKWTSSDESIATVDANGKVTAVKVGKAIITVTTVDGSKTATCQVTVDFATGMEEDLVNTQIYTRNSMICINPIQPLQATIISMAGKPVYDARINGATQISVAKGVYIVKLTNAGNTITTKVSVY